MTEEAKLPPVLLVGCGKMGGALLAGWRQRGISACVVVDPATPDALRGPGEIPPDFVPAAVVLAIKPQKAAETLPQYGRFAAAGALVISIMAGRGIAGIRAALAPQAAIVRAMPNTPAAIGQGITVCCPGPGVTAAGRALADALLGAVGTVAWVEDEALIDPVTAVSGGGPAYVFLLAELLERAAIAQGIPSDLARLLARQTVSGSGALLAASPEDAAELRRAVTSPAGTTERALVVLMDDEAWPATIGRAIAAATARSRELAG